ncbi:DEAD-box ATP-dependent RNA helicase 42 [Phytophthora fragariae]|uniref:RNA helicase n=1 Tax=Phytophthora fragariae TaxID=53985 RepID=A0A6G0NG77_9STRA|nr:DEAD-box ATP-dependent RNA helicase 42 [Phytophthora fragariae]
MAQDAASPSRQRRRRSSGRSRSPSQSQSKSKSRSARASSRRHGASSRRKRSRSRSPSSSGASRSRSCSRERERRRASKSGDKHRKKRVKSERRERRRSPSHSRSRSRSRSPRRSKSKRDKSRRSARKTRRSRSRSRSQTRRRRSESKEEPKEKKDLEKDEANGRATEVKIAVTDKEEKKDVGSDKNQEKKRPMTAAAPVVKSGGATLKKFKFSGISLKSGSQAPKKKPAPFFNALKGDSKPPLKEENAAKKEQRERQKLLIEEQKKEEKAKFLAEEDAVPKQLALWTPVEEEKGETADEKKKREEQEARQRERVQKVVEEVDPLDAYMAGLVDEAAINKSRANPAANVISQSEIEAKGKINIYGTFLPPDAAEQASAAAPTLSAEPKQVATSGAQETPEEREAREERELKEFMRAIKEKREQEEKKAADATAASTSLKNGAGPEAEEDPIMKKDDTGRIYQGFEEDIIGEDSELVDQRSALEILQEQQKKKEIKPVDHSKMNYLPFQKKFYVVPKEIKDLSEEDVEAQRKESEIKVRGKSCPRPLQKWTQCGFSVRMLQLIKKHGYEEPFAIQKQALPAIMSGRDVIGIAKTGSGKTLAFLLPMFRHILAQPPLQENEGPIGIIMAPARELAQQIYVEARHFSKGLGLRATAVYGGSSVSEQIANLKRGSDIVICTPGRMIDILCMSAGKMVSLQRVTYVVLDEADRMFDMGFEPQITKIMMNIRPDRQTLLFSATFPRSVESLARKVLRKPVEITVGARSTASGDITQYVEVREENDKFMRLLQLLGLWYEKGNILVFVNKQQACDQIFQDLMKAGYPALSLHGGKDQVDRDYTIDDFKRKVRTVMVATSVAGRGLDVKDLVLVINYHCPNHMEDYVHRVGRTGRAGRKGTAYTFISPDEEEYSVDLVKALENGKQTVPPELTALAEGFKAKVTRGEARYHGSGFKGKGFTFDETERNETQRTADLQRRQYELDQGILVEENGTANEDDTDEPSKENTGAATDKPSLPAVSKQLHVDSEAMSAFIKAQKIIQNLDLQYKGNGDGSGENHFVEELEINDYPQQARWRVTQKEASDSVGELTGVAVIARGSYIPAGRKPNPSERKLYLAIEGPTQSSVIEARRELQRILDETTMQVGLGGDKYGNKRPWRCYLSNEHKLNVCGE